MYIKDAEQAAPIVQRSLAALLGAVPSQGRTGASFRFQCGTVSANAEALIAADAVGPPLANCFDLAKATGATQPQLARVRNQTLAESPTLLGAILIKNSIVRLCLATEGTVIAGMRFTSRQDVDALQLQVNTIYAGVEETAADEMDQMTFQALIGLHAAITNFLVTSERPLPRMLRFAFNQSMPTLVTAQRLYADAGRADELLVENKVVHPAFMRATGIGLAF